MTVMKASTSAKKEGSNAGTPAAIKIRPIRIIRISPIFIVIKPPTARPIVTLMKLTAFLIPGELAIVSFFQSGKLEKRITVRASIVQRNVMIQRRIDAARAKSVRNRSDEKQPERMGRKIRA